MNTLNACWWCKEEIQPNQPFATTHLTDSRNNVVKTLILHEDCLTEVLAAAKQFDLADNMKIRIANEPIN
jgi:hypothetical protein